LIQGRPARKLMCVKAKATHGTGAGLRLAVEARRRRAIRRALLAWFDDSARDLPWRRRRSPYRIWLAEILAQQTRLDAAVPYFERFVERFPDLPSLAAASQDEVLALWSGLGYYSRGRNLHRSARLLCERFDGRLPDTAAELAALPGIGRYTAGAIASIAFGRVEPAVDGNVKRVLARLFDIDADLERPPLREQLWRLAGRLLPPDRPGDFNEALMELGALVCTPRAPTCAGCPLGRLCHARRRGTQLERPPPRRRRPPRLVTLRLALIERPAGLLLVRNQAAGLFGGLWSLPLHPRGGCGEGDARGLAQALERDLGRAAAVGPRLAAFEHLLTHRRLRVRVHAVELDKGPLRLHAYSAARWIARPQQLERLGLAALTRKALAAADHPLDHPSRTVRGAMPP
jgi:A/G-specific adenine glycosylase